MRIRQGAPSSFAPLAVAGVILSTPSTAWANVGVPMIAAAWPVAWLLFLPICALEAFIVKRTLALSMFASCKVSVLANLVSTLVGIPLAWGITVVPAIVAYYFMPNCPSWMVYPLGFIAGISWLPPVQNSWQLAPSGVALCLPFYFASVAIETRVALKLLPNSDDLSLRRALKRANQISYLLIAAGIAALGAYGAWG